MQTQAVIKETIEISAAHHLPNYEGKCANLHGHNYRVEVYIKGPILESGMVCDFSKIKELVKQYDHVDLNTLIENPTAENIAKEMCERISALGDFAWVRVRVCEDRDSSAEVEM